MSQGYGPDNGQQGQWGPSGQTPPPPAAPWGQGEQQASPAQPQWGQAEQQAPAAQPQWGQASPSQPQWGQASPAAPGGYPGAAGQSGLGTGPQFDAGDGVNWKRVKLIGLILLAGTVAVLLVRLGINLAIVVGADDMVASDTGGEVGAVGVGSSLVLLLLYGLNFLLGLVLFVLGIVAAVMGRGRARVGGIVVAAAIPVSVVLYWVFNFVTGVILGITGAIDGSSSTAVYYGTAGAGALHALLIVVILALGSYFVHSTASKKLSA